MKVYNEHIVRLMEAYLTGKLDEEGRRELDAWCEASEKNRKFFARICREDRIAREVPIYAEVDEVRAFRRFQKRVRGRKRFLRRVARCAAILLLPLAAVAVWQWMGAERETVVVQEIVPGSFKAVLTLAGGEEVTMANPDLTWEKTLQYNVGVDFSLFKGRVSGVVDFYTSRTSDLLMAMSIPSLTGYTSTYANVGKTSNIGVDITLNTVNVKTHDFEWSTTINAAWQKDKIDELANGKEDDINNNWFIGEGLEVIYDYESAGIWHEEDAAEMAKFNANGHSFTAGMVRPVDQNGDYRIDPNDDRVIIGHTRPRWTFGMTNTFSYKNFDLSILLYGRFGYTVDTGGEWQGGRYMQRKIDYYNENNKDAEYQKPIYNIGGGDPYYRILGYKQGSFLKVRNISLGYTFPQKLIAKSGLTNLRIYIQAKNPGRIFSSIDFLELDASQAYTSTWNRGFTVGLNVGF